MVHFPPHFPKCIFIRLQLYVHFSYDRNSFSHPLPNLFYNNVSKKLTGLEIGNKFKQQKRNRKPCDTLTSKFGQLRNIYFYCFKGVPFDLQQIFVFYVM